MTFDGSTIEGYSRIQESDMLAKPDPNTFELLPGGDADAPVARMFCDIQIFSGEPVPRRSPLRAEAQPRAGPGEGLHVLRRPRDGVLLLPHRRERIEPLDNAGYFDLTAHDLGSQLRKQTVLRLEAMGIPVEYSFHENGPSQHEIDLRYTDALDDGRQRDDVPAHHQGGRGTTTACTRRSCPSRSPARSVRGCTRTCRCSRATSTRSTIPATSTACRRSRSTSSPACSCTRARSSRSPTSGSTRTSG